MENKQSRFNPHEILTQQDYQTCLLCCLLMGQSALNQEGLDYSSLERSLNNESFGLYPANFALSRCAAFSRRFPSTRLDIFVDNQKLTRYLNRINKEESISLFHQKISVDWIQEGLGQTGLIAHVDQLHLGGDVHNPHFIYLYQGSENQMHMVDPVFGSDTQLSPVTLEHALMGLKYQMLWSPLVIAMKKS